MGSEGEILYDVFTIQNNRAGFEDLFSKITSVFKNLSKVTYQSGTLYSNHSKMEKHGSSYLRCALLLATQRVCMW